MSPIDGVLSRLEPHRVRKTGTERWRACCPCPTHSGHNATLLSVGVGDTGAVLLHCWAGCEVEEIAGALGLELVELFPPRDRQGRPRPHAFLPADVFHAVRHQAAVAAVIAADMRQHKNISDHDWQSLTQAVRTLDDIARAAYAHR